MLAHATAGQSALRQPSAASRRVKLSFGPTLDYVDRGAPNGVPVVFLHGYTDSWLSFATVLPHLPARMRLLAYSQRGHGDSDRPVAGFHTRDLAGDLEGFLDAVGIERAVIVGHSMGSQVAARFAITRPERVLGLALVGGFATLGGNAVVGELRQAVAALSDPVDPDFVREFQASTLARPCSDTFLDMIVEESRKVPARVWREALDGQIGEDVSPDLGRIGVPTLIAWGDRDSIVSRAAQEAMATAIPDARFVICHGSGHALHWEDPASFAAELRAFVDGLSARA